MKKRGKFKKLSKSNEIVFMLNGYEDIFSDFDPRPHSNRSLSSDFLDELKRASRDKSFKERVNLKLILEKNKRNNKKEKIISKRLNKHFDKHNKLYIQEKYNIIKRGVLFIILGILTMGLATYILFYYGKKDILTTFLVILLEPAGWFLFWEGLGQVIFGSDNIKHELKFYRIMSKARIFFNSY